MRFRYWFMFGGSGVMLAALFSTDPDVGWIQELPFGSSTLSWLLLMARGIVALTFAHLGRKALFDYPEADMQKLFRKSLEGSTGAGLALVALSIVSFGLLLLFATSAKAQDVNTYIPAQATQYLPTLKAAQTKNWPDHPMPNALGALVEHESCISLKHSRCWNPKSQLKTAREEGAGFGQITRAYRKDGTTRFDALQELKDRHPMLAEWNWQNVYTRPDLQLLGIVLKSKDDYRTLYTIKDPVQRLYFADAAYNGGMGGVNNERRACGLKKGCNPQLWFENVEYTCLKSTEAIYGKRSACDINRHHVHDVFHTRAPKYLPFFV